MKDLEKKIRDVLIDSGIDLSKIEIASQFKDSRKVPSKYIKIGKFEKIDPNVLKSLPCEVTEVSFFEGAQSDCFLYYIN